MFCIKCGNRLPEDARFCSNCGFPVPDSLISSNEEHETVQADNHERTELPHAVEPFSTGLIQESAESNERQEMKAFIGPNADYYLRQWGQSTKPEQSVSWNWAAFFLTGYWFAYRKMYVNMIVWFLIIFALEGVTLYIEKDHMVLSSIINLVFLGINLLIGMYGNALYFQHMRKRLNRWHEDPELKAKTTLSKLGGTGWLAIIIMAVVNVILIIIVSLFLAASIFNSGLNHEEFTLNTWNNHSIHNDITFGTGSDDSGVTGIQDQFSADTPIYMEADFNSPVGTDTLKVLLVKQDDSNEVIIDKWNEDIDPNWNSIYFNLYDPDLDGYLDPGSYIVRMYDGNKLLNEGNFEITTSLFDDGTTNDIQF